MTSASTKQYIDFEYLNHCLMNLGATASASEVHGFVSGCMCTPGIDPKLVREFRTRWLVELIQYVDLEHLTLDDETNTMIDHLLSSTHFCLQDDDYGFMPLLPDEQVSIARRTEELGAWCHGFLHGIARSGVEGEDSLGTEANDALRDLAQISQVVVDDNLSEEDERHWVDVVEYVKVLVLTLYAELQLMAHNEKKAPPSPPRKGDTSAPSVH